MDTKFTKGLWTHQKGDDWIYDDSKDGHIICCAMRVNGSYEARRANAHLIAAAPDMYSLLEEFKLFAVRQGWDHVLINDAEKLLAKARGE